VKTTLFTALPGLRLNASALMNISNPPLFSSPIAGCQPLRASFQAGFHDSKISKIRRTSAAHLAHYHVMVVVPNAFGMDLRQVVDSWPNLSRPLKDAILATTSVAAKREGR
jgi:hypothetical protein